jgi:phage terminase Nu1 subunit (DNA packaging protein)
LHADQAKERQRKLAREASQRARKKKQQEKEKLRQEVEALRKKEQQQQLQQQKQQQQKQQQQKYGPVIWAIFTKFKNIATVDTSASSLGPSFWGT